MSSAMMAYRKIFNQAKHVVVLTGAGISAESGIPTFRGAGGLWRQFNATVCLSFSYFEWWRFMKNIPIFHFCTGLGYWISFQTITVACLGILSLSTRTCTNEATKSSLLIAEIISNCLDSFENLKPRDIWL